MSPSDSSKPEYGEWVATEGPLRRGVMQALSPEGAIRRFAKLWGFLGFCLLIIFLARSILLPFLLGLLIAYVLAPAVHRLSTRPDKTRRLPRWIALSFCYTLLIAFIAVFLGTLVPLVTRDIARVAREGPTLYKTLNDTWAPRAAAWIEQQVPAGPPAVSVEPTTDVTFPPSTPLVVTPLGDGRLAIQLAPTGVEVTTAPDGTMVVKPTTHEVKPQTIEDRLRHSVTEMLAGLQTQIGEVFRLGQRLVQGLVRSVFTFFLVLMIGAFVLLDADRLNVFARNLAPAAYRDDYDVIVEGVNTGLSGVIRGQLIICAVNGALTYIGLVIFGVKYALLLATVAAIFSLIPIFGSILSTIPIVLAALVSGESGVDLVRAVAILAWIVGIHLIEANFLNPRIIGTAAKIHPVLVIFALVLGESTYGLTGALFAVPVASIVQFLFVFFRSRTWRTDGQTT